MKTLKYRGMTVARGVNHVMKQLKPQWAASDGVQIFIRAESEHAAIDGVRQLLPHATFTGSLRVITEQGELDPFVHGYLQCALWSSNGSDETPLDQTFDIGDISQEALARAQADCAAFQANNLATLALANIEPSRAGHLLWLDRCGHGTGFWDEYSLTSCPNYTPELILAERDRVRLVCNCPYHACQRLSAAAQKLGNLDLYVGDDHKLYFA